MQLLIILDNAFKKSIFMNKTPVALWFLLNKENTFSKAIHHFDTSLLPSFMIRTKYFMEMKVQIDFIPNIY